MLLIFKTVSTASDKQLNKPLQYIKVLPTFRKQETTRFTVIMATTQSYTQLNKNTETIGLQGTAPRG